MSVRPQQKDWTIAVLQLLYTKSAMISGFSFKKVPPCMQLN